METPPPLPAKTKLEWYEHIWIALPIALVAFGGAIGGGCGGAAWATNRAIFLKHKARYPALCYMASGLVSIAAVVLWLVVAMLIHAILHFPKNS